MRTTLIFFIFLISSVFGSAVYSQTSAQADSESYRLRQFDQKHIDEYLSSPEYSYVADAAPLSLWDSLMQWLAQKLAKLFGHSDPERIVGAVELTVRILIWALGIFAVTMICYSIFRYGNFGFTAKKDIVSTIDFRKLEDEVLETDWAELIAKESAAGRYNTAVHLHFLQTIKILHHKSLIVWDKNKMASDYRRELVKHRRDAGFSQLVSYYHYAWFGAADMDAARYSQIEQAFIQFNAQ